MGLAAFTNVYFNVLMFSCKLEREAMGDTLRGLMYRYYESNQFCGKD